MWTTFATQEVAVSIDTLGGGDSDVSGGGWVTSHAGELLRACALVTVMKHFRRRCKCDAMKWRVVGCVGGRSRLTDCVHFRLPSIAAYGISGSLPNETIWDLTLKNCILRRLYDGRSNTMCMEWCGKYEKLDNVIYRNSVSPGFGTVPEEVSLFWRYPNFLVTRWSRMGRQGGTCYGKSMYQIWSLWVHPLRSCEWRCEMQKMGWFGVVRGTQGQRQCYHSIERIRFPIRL